MPGDVKVAAKTTFFNKHSIIRPVDLPISYTHLDVLSMPAKGYTTEELDFNKVTQQIIHERISMKEKIQRSYSPDYSQIIYASGSD